MKLYNLSWKNESTRILIDTIHRSQAKYGIRLAKAVQTNYDAKWREHDTINYFNKGNTGRTERVRTEANIEVLGILINDLF